MIVKNVPSPVSLLSREKQLPLLLLSLLVHRGGWLRAKIISPRIMGARIHRRSQETRHINHKCAEDTILCAKEGTRGGRPRTRANENVFVDFNHVV